MQVKQVVRAFLPSQYLPTPSRACEDKEGNKYNNTVSPSPFPTGGMSLSHKSLQQGGLTSPSLRLVIRSAPSIILGVEYPDI